MLMLRGISPADAVSPRCYSQLHLSYSVQFPDEQVEIEDISNQKLRDTLAVVPFEGGNDG